MTAAVEAIALGAAALGCIFTGVRTRMLSHDFGTWANAPWYVRWLTSLKAAYLGGVAISIGVGASAGLRETGLLVILAAVTGALMINLDRNGRAGT